MNWIIGDIHGMLEEFNRLLEAIRKEDADADIFCVGDYVDRGPNSRGVIDRILDDGKIRCVRGNHDDVFHCLLIGKPTPYSDYRGEDAPQYYLDGFFRQGMIETFQSYGVEAADLKESLRRNRIHEVVKAVPPSHVEFIVNLPLMIDEADFFVVHAFVDPSLPPEQQMETAPGRQGMLWGRFSSYSFNAEKRWFKRGYFGHTPTSVYGMEGPIVGEQIVLLDTNCCRRGTLTAMCHETGQTISV